MDLASDNKFIFQLASVHMAFIPKKQQHKKLNKTGILTCIRNTIKNIQRLDIVRLYCVWKYIQKRYERETKIQHCKRL